MDMDSFHDLAFRLLESPEDPALRREMADVLSAHPERADEWQSLREAHHRLADALPIAVELTTPAPTDFSSPPIPWARLGMHAADAAPTPPLPRRNVAWARWTMAGLAAAVTLGFFLSTRRTSPTIPSATELAAHAPASLARVLTAPLSEVLATITWQVQRDANTSAQLRRPLVATVAGPATVEWTGAELADITIRQRGQVIWQSEATHSPVTTPSLPVDGTFELEFRPAGSSAAKISYFVTTAADAHDEATLENLVAQLAEEPIRLGDAVATWRALPADLRESETGARLGLWLGREANQADLFTTARAALTTAP